MSGLYGYWPDFALAIVVGLLLNAAVVKLVAPSTTAKSLAVMFPRAKNPDLSRQVRVFALLELAIAVGLMTGWPAKIAVTLLAVVGTVFFFLGLFGTLRGSTAPCGCLSLVEDRPLGVFNSLIGLSFVGLSAIFSRVLTFPYSISQVTRLMITAALSTVTVAVWANRRSIASHVGPVFYRP